MIGAISEMLDSNVLIYAFSTDPRSDAAERLLQRRCIVSIQALNEFANVSRRKMGMSWDEIGRATEAIRQLCSAVLPLDVEAHSNAIRIAERYQLSFFDALMISSGLAHGCEVLWSEDMRDGLVIDRKLHIRNPFE
jgi:predicted nucleic acid-binding protein